MRRSRPRDKRSQRPPKSRDEGFRINRRSTKRRTERDHQRSTEPWWQSTTDLSLSRRWSNELKKGGDSHVYTIKSYRQVESPPAGSLLRHTPRSRPSSLPRGWPTSLPRSRPRVSWSRLLRATMKSTGYSPKRTSNDDYLVKQHLRVNATTGCEIYSTEHAKALHEGSGERKCTWTL